MRRFSVGKGQGRLGMKRKRKGKTEARRGHVQRRAVQVHTEARQKRKGNRRVQRRAFELE